MAALDADGLPDAGMPSTLSGSGGEEMPMSMPSTLSGHVGDFAEAVMPSTQDLLDATLPVIVFTTAAGDIDPADPIELSVTDDSGVFSSIIITAQYSPSGLVQVVYDGSSFTAEYDAGSTVTPTAQGFDFSLEQDAPGWWEDVTITVTAVDGSGNLASGVRAFTVPLGPGAPTAGVSDTTKPVVTFISPPPDSDITPTTPIVFEAIDNLGDLVNVSVDVTYPDGTTEAIYDGDNFTPLYAGVSTVVSIANGFQFTIRRKRGGWPAAPVFNVEAVDGDGNRSI